MEQNEHEQTYYFTLIGNVDSLKYTGFSGRELAKFLPMLAHEHRFDNANGQKERDKRTTAVTNKGQGQAGHG